jgi:thioesterase domain-containing protein
MVPAAFVRLDAFPLTPNGKLDRRALPAPDDAAYARLAYEAPQGETETVLADIWADMLGVERISRNDNFFNLGGHSFLALRVMSEINRRLKLHVTAPTFFMHPTIEQLARNIEHSHAQTNQRVLTLQTGHIGLPIYFMGARPEEFRFAQLIGSDRRIFAIDVPLQTAWLSAGEAGDMEALPTIEQLGARYGEILAAHAGPQPCVIAGYCIGGKIAFEAARVVQRAGGNVAFILLLDARVLISSGTYTLGPALESLSQIWRGGVEHAFSLHRLSASLSDTWSVVRFLLSRMPDSAKHRLNAIKTRLDKMMNRPAPPIVPSGYFDEEGRPIDTLVVNRLALYLGRLWHPQPLDAACVLIRANNLIDMLPGNDPAGGWDGLFGRGLEIVQATGDHHSMMTGAHAQALARQLDFILRRSEAAWNDRPDAFDNDFTRHQPQFDQAPPQPERTVA